MSKTIQVWGLALAIFSFTPFAIAKTAQGVFTVVKGEVSIIPAGKSKAKKVRVGTKVHAKDVIEAGKDSRAKIVMTDNNILNISPESKIELAEYENDPSSGSKKVMLNLMYGKVRSSVKQKYDGERNVYRVKTPSAVAGVRGTDFIVDFNIQSKQSQVITFTGVVQVAAGISPNGSLINPVAVRPGQFTVSTPSQAPQKPAELPKSQLASIQKNSDADLADDSNPKAEKERSPANRPEKKDTSKEDGDKAPKQGDKKQENNPKQSNSGAPEKKEGGNQSPAPKQAGATPASTKGPTPLGPAPRQPSSLPTGGAALLPPPPPVDNISGVDQIVGAPRLGEFDNMQPVSPGFNGDGVTQPRLPEDRIHDIIQNSTEVIIRPIQQ